MVFIFAIITLILFFKLTKEKDKIKNIERNLNNLLQKGYLDFKSFKIVDILFQHSKKFPYSNFEDIENLIINNKFLNIDKKKEEKEDKENKENINNINSIKVLPDENFKDDDKEIKNTKNIIEPTKTYIEEKVKESTIKTEEPKNIKTKKEIDFSKVLLFLGTIFILISSVIFSTTSWKSISSFEKIITLIVVGNLQLLISLLYYKKFKMKNISLAFYILGNTILSLTILSFGYFYLKNSWYLILSIFFITLMVFHYLGLKIYKNIILQWTYLLFSNLAIFFIIKFIIDVNNIVILILSIYSLLLILLTKNFEKKDLEEDIFSNKKIKHFINYSKINIIFIIFAFILLSNSNIINFITIIVIAISIFSFKIYGEDDFYPLISFTFLLLSSIFKISEDSNISILTYLSTIPLILSILNSLDLFSKKYLIKVSYIITFLTLIIFILNNINTFVFNPSIYDIFSIFILIVSFNLTINKINKNVTFFVNPFLIFLLIIQTNRYLEYTLKEQYNKFILINCIIVFLIYLFHILFKKDNKYIFRNYISISIFPIYLLLLSIYYNIFIDDIAYSIYALIFAMIMFLINSFLNYKKDLGNYIFSILFCFSSILLIISINLIYHFYIINILLFVLVILILKELLLKNNKKLNILKTSLNITYFIIAEIYILINYLYYILILDNMDDSKLILLAILVVLLLTLIIYKRDTLDKTTNMYIFTFIGTILFESFIPIILYENLYMPIIIYTLVYLLLNMLLSKFKNPICNNYLSCMTLCNILYNIIIYGRDTNDIIVILLLILPYILQYIKLKDNDEFICIIPISINILILGKYLSNKFYMIDNLFIIYFTLILIISIIIIYFKYENKKVINFIKFWNILYLLVGIYLYFNNINSYKYLLLNILPLYYFIQILKEYKLYKVNSNKYKYLTGLFFISYILSVVFTASVLNINILWLFILYTIVLYLAFILINKRYNINNNYIFILCNISLCIFSSILLYNDITFSYGLEKQFINILVFSLAIIFIILSCKKINTNIFTIIIVLHINIFILDELLNILILKDIKKFYILFLIAYSLILLCSRFINKNIIIKNKNNKIIYIDYFALCGLLIPFLQFGNLDIFGILLIISINLLGIFKRNLNKEIDKKIILLSSTLFIISIMFRDNYLIIPYEFYLQFRLIIGFIYLLILKYILDKKFNVKIIYYYTICSFVILFIDLIIDEHIYNIIFLCTLCCIVLLYGIKIKSKKFVSISTLFLLLLTINSTFNLWKEFIWFIYLIIIGIIFIGLALYFENRKKNKPKDNIYVKKEENIKINKKTTRQHNYKNKRTKYKQYKIKRRKIKNKIYRKNKIRKKG